MLLAPVLIDGQTPDRHEVLQGMEMSKPLLGSILIETKVCSTEQVEEALQRQRELAERNHYKHLGTILLEMRSINLTQLHRALQWQQHATSERESA